MKNSLVTATALLLSQTGAFVPPASFLSSSQRGLQQKKDDVGNPENSSFASRVRRESSLNYKNSAVDSGGNEQTSDYFKSFVDSLFKTPDQTERDKSNIQSMMDKNNLDGVYKAYREKGVSPDLEFDIKDDKGNVVSTGNNIAHVIASKFMDEKGVESNFLDYHAIMGAFATVGGDFDKKNSDGLTPSELIGQTVSPSKGEMAHYMNNLKKEQMSYHVEIGDYVYSGDGEYSSYSTGATEQIRSLASQKKLSDIAKDRVPVLVASGANLDSTLGDVDDTSEKRTIRQEMNRNWGSERASLVDKMDRTLREAESLDVYEKLQKPFSYKKASKDDVDERLNTLNDYKEEKRLFSDFDNLAANFKTSGDKSTQVKGIAR